MFPATYDPPAPFGMLRTYRPAPDERVVVMELAATAELAEAWAAIPAYPNLLEVMSADPRRVLLRYAAIAWNIQPIRADSDRADRLLATWGLQLTEVYAWLFEHARTRMALFVQPVVFLDLESQVRVALLTAAPKQNPTARHAPELVRGWPRCDEPAIVFLIGRVLSELWRRPADLYPMPVDAVLATCTAERPGDRYTLADLAGALAGAGGDLATIRDDDRYVAWNVLEAGLGLIASGQHAVAASILEAARERGADPELVQAAFERIADQAVSATSVPVRTRSEPPPPIRLEDALADGARLEGTRAFAEALALYRRVPAFAVTGELALAMARVALELALPAAVDDARLAVERGGGIAARQLEVRALHANRRFTEALAAADAIVALTPDDGVAHYLRGRCLFALERFDEARGVFDRAAVLAPQLLEVMVLRRESDRAMAAVRARVGSQPAPFALPPHLEMVRPLLTAQRYAEALAVLARHGDPAARLLRASCLVAAGRADEALAIYDELLPDPAAVTGQAFALVALDRAADALALVAASDDADAREVRARALAALGRHAEAEREIDRLVVERGDRAELRARVFRFR